MSQRQALAESAWLTCRGRKRFKKLKRYTLQCRKDKHSQKVPGWLVGDANGFAGSPARWLWRLKDDFVRRKKPLTPLFHFFAAGISWRQVQKRPPLIFGERENRCFLRVLRKRKVCSKAFVRCTQRRNEGGKEGAVPRAPNHCRGGGVEKSQKCHLNTVHLLPKDLRFEHRGTKLCSCPGRHLTLRPGWTNRYLNATGWRAVVRIAVDSTKDQLTASALALMSPLKCFWQESTNRLPVAMVFAKTHSSSAPPGDFFRCCAMWWSSWSQSSLLKDVGTSVCNGSERCLNRCESARPRSCRIPVNREDVQEQHPFTFENSRRFSSVVFNLCCTATHYNPTNPR